jgi:hypothetical protein
MLLFHVWSQIQEMETTMQEDPARAAYDAVVGKGPGIGIMVELYEGEPKVSLSMFIEAYVDAAGETSEEVSSWSYEGLRGGRRGGRR